MDEVMRETRLDMTVDGVGEVHATAHGHKSVSPKDLMSEIERHKEIFKALEKIVTGPYFIVYEGEKGANIITHGPKTPGDNENIKIMFNACCEMGKNIAKGKCICGQCDNDI